MIVVKFGGSSLGTAARIEHCVQLVQRELERRPVVVVSACGSTTSMLQEAAQRAVAGTVEVTDIRGFHDELVGELQVAPGCITALLDELETLLQGVSLTRELTPRTMDLVLSFGERLSTELVAGAFSRTGTRARAVPAYEIGLNTDDRHGMATPLSGIGPRIAVALGRIAELPVVTGFLGRGEGGAITTLGTSGSDFTASILGAALGADEVQIWTDVDGVMTCDPSIDPSAKGLAALSFDEASELAYYGARVLHPNTLIPAIHAGIEVRVLNTLREEDRGTRIIAGAAPGTRMAKAVVYKENVCHINVASPRLLSAARLLSEGLEIVARHGVTIHMATTSESTISMVTDGDTEIDENSHAIEELRQLGEVVVERGKAIICVVGEELRGQVGVLSRIFGEVAAQGIKATMVSQAGSEINIAFLVDNEEIRPAVLALHRLLLNSERE